MRVPSSQASKQVTVECQGHVVRARVRHDGGGGSRGGVRGVVVEMSGASRRRLYDRLFRMRYGQGQRVSFITVSMPGQAFPSAVESVNHLRRFCKRLLRRWSGASCIWRKELQDRGAPHFHMFWFGLPFIDKMQLVRWWTASVKEYCTPEELERGLSVDVQEVKVFRQAVGYMGKYMAKPSCCLGYAAYRAAGMVDEEGEFCSGGRWWGVVNAECLPWDVKKELTAAVGPWFFQFKRCGRKKWKGVNRRREFGFLVFVESAGRWWALLDVLRDTVDGEAVPF